MNKTIDDFFTLRNQIFNYFKYIEDWRVLPIYDSRHHYWRLDENKDGSGDVHFSDKEVDLDTENQYTNEIYTQRHLNKWVYRGKDFTMIVVDTHTDGNQFLQIFSNSKERK